MLKLDTEDALSELHTGNVKEHLHLEYKASDAIDKKNDAKKLEMARDVSAFANADGGQIVYGMSETDHEPAGLDDGFDPKAYPEIWFEQVLQQHITPIIEGVRPYHVLLHTGRVAVVIDVPATKADPHQVSDGRYYRRHNYNRLIMEHYEVQQAFRRTTTAEPFVTLSLRNNPTHLVYDSNVETSRDFTVYAHISNRSNQPAMYAQITIGVDADLTVMKKGSYTPAGTRLDERRKYNLFRQQWSSSQRLPIFKEAVFPLVDSDFSVSVHSAYLRGSTHFYLPVEVLSPGFSSLETWYLHCFQHHVKLLPPRPDVEP
jgi:hypothetical protein